MSPQTVNAYYNPTTNEICFPAAILQPPFYSPDADDAVNYGAIGVVIGHEMTHRVRRPGPQFRQGRQHEQLVDRRRSAAAFKAKTDILVKQFDAIGVLPAKDGQPAIHANGALSLGENIADQGGLRVAWTAYQNSLAGSEAPAPIDGFTPDAQRFSPGLCHAVGAEHPRRGDRPSDEARRAFAGQMARERHAAQPCRISTRPSASPTERCSCPS